MSLLSLDPVEFKINVLASCLNMHEMVVITSVCHFKRRRRIEGSLVCTVHDQKKKKKKKWGGIEFPDAADKRDLCNFAS